MKQPVDILRANGKLYGRDAIWAAIRELREFSLVDIQLYSDKENDLETLNGETARTYVHGLEKAGYLERLPRASGLHSRVSWKLINDVGINAPRVTKHGKPVKHGLSREQMWRTMRILKDFTSTDLVVTGSTAECQINESDARDYILHLHKAGYLIEVTPASNAGRPGRYRLLPAMQTGPKPPMVQRVKQVFDPNLNKVMWPKEGK